MTPREILQQATADLGVTMDATFVPWSKSRSFKADAKTKDRSLNWHVTLKREGREILQTDFTSGIGNAPSYKQGRLSLEDVEALNFETEHGIAARKAANIGKILGGKPITLDICDVVYALVSDASAIDYPTYEEWASDLGYDADSRKGERVYRTCLEIGLKLRAALGEDGLAKLKTACEGY